MTANSPDQIEFVNNAGMRLPIVRLRREASGEPAARR